MGANVCWQRFSHCWKIEFWVFSLKTIYVRFLLLWLTLGDNLYFNLFRHCTDLKMSFPPNWQHIRDNFWFNFSAEFMFLLFICLLIVLSILHVCGLFIVCLVRWSRHSNHNPCVTMLVYVCMLSVGVTTSIASTLIFGPSSVWRRQARRSVLLRDSNWHSLSNC